MPTEVVFQEEKIDYLLYLFGKDVDEDGFVIDADSEERIESTDGGPIKMDDIGYVGHGSAEFVEDDISSITSYLRNRERSD